MMFDDADVRRVILGQFPTLEAWRLDVEPYDYGVEMNAGLVVDTEQGRKRLNFRTKAIGRTLDEVTQDIVSAMSADAEAANMLGIASDAKKRKTISMPEKRKDVTIKLPSLHSDGSVSIG